VRDATRRIRAGIEALPELFVFGEPVMSVFAFGSGSLDVFAVGDAMDARGWHLDRQRNPDALHLMLSPEHDRVADAFLADLRRAVARGGSAKSREARYS
jgi:glutamate/tyrosine decarboxylase-like PLP-dependent enzyme